MATTSVDYVWDTWSSTTAGTGCYREDYARDIWNGWTTDSSTSSPTALDTSDGQIWYRWSTDYEQCAKKYTIYANYGDDNYTAVWTTWVSHEDYATPERYAEIQKTIQNRIDHETEKLANLKPPSTEQLRAKEIQMEIRKEWNKILVEEREQEREQAELTAQELLLDIVGKEELQRYKDTDRLFVKGKQFDYVLRKGKGVHKIEKNSVVDFVEKKQAKGRFICVHPKQSFDYPDTDNIITLKLWIENNEEAFLRIGNQHKGLETISDFDKVVGL